MAWDKERIHALVEAQRAFFRSGETLPVAWRIGQLRKLRSAIMAHEKELTEALSEDLGRSEGEAYLCDIGSCIMEINETIRGLRRWARPKRFFSGFVCFPSTVTKVRPMPYGVSLIISPFNFPVLLSFGVLTAAIAGGNTAVIKTSSKSPACTAAMQKLIRETFDERYVTIVDGGHDVADICLEERFDKIFYTGSPKVGKHVLSEAAKNLTSTALELGGETGNWCVIRKDADIADAARKIVFFKLLNCGQICIDINQVAVAGEIAEPFIDALKAEYVRQIGENAVLNSEYPRLINREAYDKCAAEAERYRERVVFGGFGDPGSLKYAPTVIYPVSADEPVVNRELFCPILPVVPFKDDEAEGLMRLINSREHGLALYLFTKDIRWAERAMATSQFGGGCINEVCMQMMVKGVPFNGTGHSGMGAYHGEWGFREFTHPATVLRGSTRFNMSIREHPYTGRSGERKMRLMRLFEK